MSDTVRGIIALLCLGGAVWVKAGKPGLDMLPSPAPIVVVPEPLPEHKAAVAQVTTLLKGRPEAARYAALYGALAEHLEKFQVPDSTGQLRTVNERAGMWTFGSQVQIPGLGTALNDAHLQIMGTDNTALDAASRAKAVATFRALAWACNEAL